MSTWFSYALLFLLLAASSGFAQALDLAKAAATCIPSAAASAANLRSFSANQAALELEARFSLQGNNRACWDFPLQADLSQMSALRLRYRSFNTPVVSQFNVYLRMGGNWYAASFAPEGNGAWEECIIPKTSFLPESGSNSWRQANMLRIAAWRGGTGELLLQFVALELLAPNCSIALLRSGGNSEQQKEAYKYARHLGDNLFQGGLYPAVLEGDDCSASLLYPYQLVLLPFAEAASPAQLSAINLYIQNRGKVGVFHALPPLLAARLQFPAGRFTLAKSLPAPLAMVEPVAQRLTGSKSFRQQSGAFIALAPSEVYSVNAWWVDSKGKNSGYPAIIENRSGFWMTHVFLNQDSEPAFLTLLSQMQRFLPGLEQAAAAASLNRARFAVANAGENKRRQAAAELARANQAFQNRQYEQSRLYAINSLNQLRNAGIMQMPARPNEFRAMWCRSPLGLPGHNWDESISLLKKASFSAIFPNMSHAFASTHANARQIEECLQACRRHGLAMHLWLSCLGAQDFSEVELRRLAAQGRLQCKANGAVLPWLCPNQSRNRKQIIESAAELCRRYALDGLHLDLIRYPGSQACFCDACREAFAAYLQKPIPSWPDTAQYQARQEWEEFRRLSISNLVKDIRLAAKAQRPQILLSAAVYTDWQSARSTVGQDWVNWQRGRLLDFVCPMNYRASATLFANDLRRQKQQLGGLEAVLPGIGVSSENMSAQELIRQVQACRQAGAVGFILFEYTPRLAFDLLPQLQ
ncbi:MAG: family 10 glycosylhydrolase [Oligosphaeraceae bacterium]|nr:family 10 glycosylhydrolase [Oligosphaeraceae bacterium]